MSKRVSSPEPAEGYRCVLILPRGAGRDFVLADVHGMVHLIPQILDVHNFNPEIDRLFLVGDLVDRGPYSDAILELLAYPWVFVVRGNHEQMFLDCYQGGRLDAAALQFNVENNGAGWWLDLSPERRQAHLAAYARMPLAIEVQTSRGLVGIVHAEVPRGMDWSTFKENLELGDNRTIQSAIWGRSRDKAGDRNGVPGLGRLYCGHTIQESVRRLGNCYYLDTGAFLEREDVAPEKRLTAVNLITATSILTGEPGRQSWPWTARFERIPAETRPFGQYVKD